jgi:hypothetical protein
MRVSNAASALNLDAVTDAGGDVGCQGTNNPGRWISRCHNIYRLEAGMAFFVEYAG